MIQLTLEGASRSLDISADTHIFKSTCTSWAQYQPGINDLNITHVRKCVTCSLPRIFFGPLLMSAIATTFLKMSSNPEKCDHPDLRKKS